jgi:opacity protein-like surface antigen
MRKLSSLVIVSVLAIAGSARAQDDAPAAAPAADPAAAPAEAPAVSQPPVAAQAAPDSKIQVGVAFLPMVLGKAESSGGGFSSSKDAALGYGVGLSVGYNVIPGLSVGIAPQMIFNVKEKDGKESASKEIDIMARVAYAYHVIPNLAVYGEVLPGYSIISLSSDAADMGNGSKLDNPKGLVIAFGAGAAYDINDQLFVNLGVGYQMGFQKVSMGGADYDMKTKYLRIALGVGMKF